MKVDLHMHSTASDGRVPPTELVRLASDGGLDLIAVTDHDTVDGVEPALAEARRTGRIDVVTGIEVSTHAPEGELHILGYFVDPTDQRLRAHGSVASDARSDRLRRMVDHLRGAGLEITFEGVVEQAGGDVSSLGRPHLAREMVRLGIVDTVPDAFDQYIGNDHPAYIATDLLSPAGAIEMIHRAGGVAIWAHPAPYHFDALLPGLLAEGLDGIEVYRPRNSPQWTRALDRAASRHGEILRSGGSDWHGPDDGNLGVFKVDAGDVEPLLDRRTGSGAPA
jgi:3',5'-nucleoside bisphosphate phosphatase